MKMGTMAGLAAALGSLAMVEASRRSDEFDLVMIDDGSLVTADEADRLRRVQRQRDIIAASAPRNSEMHIATAETKRQRRAAKRRALVKVPHP